MAYLRVGGSSSDRLFMVGRAPAFRALEIGGVSGIYEFESCRPSQPVRSPQVLRVPACLWP